MTNQRLRNLTTGILHTTMDDVVADIEYITGANGLMTHQLPRAFNAMHVWLKDRVQDERFWNDAWDTGHVGETYQLDPMTSDERNMFWRAYAAMPSPFARKVDK